MRGKRKGRTAETVRPTPSHRLTLKYPYEKQRYAGSFFVLAFSYAKAPKLELFHEGHIRII